MKNIHGNAMQIGGVGFEPTNPKKQIYSLPVLTARSPTIKYSCRVNDSVHVFPKNATLNVEKYFLLQT